MAEMGIDTYHGRAYFENQNTVIVGEDKLRGKYTYLATGTKPREFNILGEECMTTSEESMETEKLPEGLFSLEEVIYP